MGRLEGGAATGEPWIYMYCGLINFGLEFGERYFN